MICRFHIDDDKYLVATVWTTDGQKHVQERRWHKASSGNHINGTNTYDIFWHAVSGWTIYPKTIGTLATFPIEFGRFYDL